jgi:hypothetical protein
MKRLVLISASVLAAGGIAATPAVAGLAGNPSFSHQIPVRVPSQAQSPRLVDDHGGDVRSTPTAIHKSTSRHAEPGDDRGGASRSAEPGDDRGGLSSHAEQGDDRGGSSRAAEPGDDSGGHGGRGDNGGNGGGSGSGGGEGSGG